MNQGISKQLKQYLKEIRLLLPIYGKDKRIFIKDLKESLIEYIELNPDCNWEDIIIHFEAPEDAVYKLHNIFRSVTINFAAKFL